MPAIARCTSSERASGNRPRDLLQALRIGQALPRQRFEGAHLGAGGRHARDARRDGAQFDHIGQRPVAQVGLRDHDILVARTRQRAHGVFVGLDAAQARQRGRMRHVAGARGAHRRQLPRDARVGPDGWCRRDRPRSCPGCRGPCDRRSCAGTPLAPARATASRGCAPTPSCGCAPPRRRRRAQRRGSVRARGRRARSRRARPPPRAGVAAPHRARPRSARDARGTCALRSGRAAAPRA